MLLFYGRLGLEMRCGASDNKPERRHKTKASVTHQIGSNRSDLKLNRSDFALDYSVTIAGTRAVS